jgi:hypothetical protein
MIGGMVSSTLLTLIVIPAIYAVVKGTAFRLLREQPMLQQRWGITMMSDMTNVMGGMGWGMTLVGVLVLVLVILGIAALAKYLFFK